MTVNFDRAYFFGDSLVDTGNILSLTTSQDPTSPFPSFPYEPGRFSNGDVWVDYLTDELNLDVDPVLANPLSSDGLNFAAGGATSGSVGAFGPTSLSQQIDGFEALFAVESIISEPALDDDLFFLWIGANDYFAFIQDDPATPETIEANFPETRQEIRDAVIDVVNINIKGAIQDLVDLGAEDIVLFNLPDLHKTPLGRSLEKEDRRSLRKLQNTHNRRLDSLAEDIEISSPGVNIINIDADELFDNILDNPNEFGITDEKSNFIGIDLYTGISQPPSQGDPNDFLFFDSVHPTTNVHSLVADLVTNELTNEGLII